MDVGGIDTLSPKKQRPAEAMASNALAVKVQSIKTAIESACLLLRVDDICSASRSKSQAMGGPQEQQMAQQQPEGGEEGQEMMEQ